MPDPYAPTDLREVRERTRLEAEVRNEFAQEVAQDTERAAERDRAMRALVISSILAVTFTLPLVALVLGLSWRILRWSAGYGW